MPITLGAASPTVLQSMAANPGMPVTNANTAQKVSAMVLDAQTVKEWEMSVPETTLPATTASSESQLGASYINNCTHHTSPSNTISVCSSDSFAQENLTSVLTERLNNKIYTTFKQNFNNINLGSINKALPIVCTYDQEIAKFIQEINIKYGISLDHTVLEVSKVPHGAKTFQVFVKTDIQQEAQSTLVRTPNISAPPPQVNMELSHQEAEINRLTQVTQQWLTEGLHQYNQP